MNLFRSKSPSIDAVKKECCELIYYSYDPDDMYQKDIITAIDHLVKMKLLKVRK
jgi:hypothetical protein